MVMMSTSATSRGDLPSQLHSMFEGQKQTLGVPHSDWPPALKMENAQLLRGLASVPRYLVAGVRRPSGVGIEYAYVDEEKPHPTRVFNLFTSEEAYTEFADALQMKGNKAPGNFAIDGHMWPRLFEAATQVSNPRAVAFTIDSRSVASADVCAGVEEECKAIGLEQMLAEVLGSKQNASWESGHALLAGLEKAGAADFPVFANRPAEGSFEFIPTAAAPQGQVCSVFSSPYWLLGMATLPVSEQAVVPLTLRTLVEDTENSFVINAASQEKLSETLPKGQTLFAQSYAFIQDPANGRWEATTWTDGNRSS